MNEYPYTRNLTKEEKKAIIKKQPIMSKKNYKKFIENLEEMTVTLMDENSVFEVTPTS